MDVQRHGKPRNEHGLRRLFDELIERLPKNNIGEILLGRPARYNIRNEFFRSRSLDSTGDVAING